MFDLVGNLQDQLSLAVAHISRNFKLTDTYSWYVRITIFLIQEAGSQSGDHMT